MVNNLTQLISLPLEGGAWQMYLRTLAQRSLTAFAHDPASALLIAVHPVVREIFHTVAQPTARDAKAAALHNKTELAALVRSVNDARQHWEFALPGSLMSRFPHWVSLPTGWATTMRGCVSRMQLLEFATCEYSNASFPAQLPIVYFELQLLNDLGPVSKRLAMGVTTTTTVAVNENKAGGGGCIGKQSGVYGIAADGSVYVNGQEVRGGTGSEALWPRSIVGFLWNRRLGTMCVTRNGAMCDEYDIEVPLAEVENDGLRACVKLLENRACSTPVLVNFGQDKFLFDLEQYARTEFGPHEQRHSRAKLTYSLANTTALQLGAMTLAQVMGSATQGVPVAAVVPSATGGNDTSSGSDSSSSSSSSSSSALPPKPSFLSGLAKERKVSSGAKSSKAMRAITQGLRQLPARLVHVPVGFEFNFTLAELRTLAVLSSSSWSQLALGFNGRTLRGLVVAAKGLQRLVYVSNGEQGLAICLWLPEGRILHRGSRMSSAVNMARVRSEAQQCLRQICVRQASRCSIRILEHWRKVPVEQMRLDFISSGKELLGLLLGLCSPSDEKLKMSSGSLASNVDGSGESTAGSGGASNEPPVRGKSAIDARAVVPTLFASMLSSTLALELLDACAARRFHSGSILSPRPLAWIVQESFRFVAAESRKEFCERLLHHVAESLLHPMDIGGHMKLVLALMVISVLQQWAAVSDASELASVHVEPRVVAIFARESMLVSDGGRKNKSMSAYLELLLLMSRLQLVGSANLESPESWGLQPERLSQLDHLALVSQVCRSLLESGRFSPWLAFQAVREQRGLRRVVAQPRGSVNVDGASDLLVMIEPLAAAESASATPNTEPEFAFSLIDEYPVSNMFESAQFIAPADTLFYQMTVAAEASATPPRREYAFWVLPSYTHTNAQRLLNADEVTDDDTESEAVQKARQEREELLAATNATAQREYPMALLREMAQWMEEQLVASNLQYGALIVPPSEQQRRHYPRVAALEERERQLLVLLVMNLNILVAGAIEHLSMRSFEQLGSGSGGSVHALSDDTTEPSIHRLPTASVVCGVRELLLPSFALKSSCSKLTSRESSVTVGINRLPGTMVSSVFEQVRTGLKALDRRAYRTSGKLFGVRLESEGAVDAGGPFREIMSHMCHELQSSDSELFIACPNAKTGIGRNRDKWIPTPASTSAEHLTQYEFVGRLMAYSFYSGACPLPLNFPSLVWKRILGMPVSFADLVEIDERCSLLKQLAELDCSDETLYCALELADSFVATLSDGTVVKLCADGDNVAVTDENRQEFFRLYTHTRLNESRLQLAAMRRGFTSVIPDRLLALCTPEYVEEAVCGKPEISIELLKVRTRLHTHLCAILCLEIVQRDSPMHSHAFSLAWCG